MGLIALASLVGLVLSTTPADAQTTRSTGYLSIVFTDVLVTSISIGGGNQDATTRTDGRGGFRFDLPAGAYNICLNGPGLRSVIDRAGGSQGEDHIIGILVGLLVPAVQSARTELQLAFPGASAPGQAGGRGPAAARDLCFPYTVNAATVPGGQTTRGHTVMPDGSIVVTGDPEIGQAGPGPADLDRDGRPDRDFNGQDPADGGRTERRVEPGDVNGDGRADRRVDPRIPPPGARAAPARSAAPQTVAFTGTVRLVR